MHPMTLYRARRVPFLFVRAGLKHSTIKRCAGPLVTLFLVHSFACQSQRSQTIDSSRSVTKSASTCIHGKIENAVVRAVIQGDDGTKLQVDVVGLDLTALIDTRQVVDD
jgi:hypothetical protein